ncbi:hypothetical protein KFE25_001643 [Diacronema lutheri]|uniref:Uncharacterized protein n=1 Tax=Diacronema lutheri TaxID=2081491 RepID=A0A8J5XH20_DIALT|nr:hypothetical protein KFE25_001643 [Diacronema lutheri]
MAGSRYAMLDWQRELNQIIKQTERNLQGRTEPYHVPLGRGGLGGLGGLGGSRTYGGLGGGGLGGGLGGVGGLGSSAGGQENSLPHADALGASSSRGAPTAGAPGGAGSGGGAFNGMSEQKLAELLNQLSGASGLQQAEELRSQQSAFKEAFSRVLDGIKFELDMRQNLAAKQMESLREEVNIALASNERRALDASRELEVGMQSKLAAEKEMRISTELQLEGIRQNVSQAQGDVNRSLGELQDMVIAQREASHTLEKELLAYQLQTEAKLTDDAKRIAQLDRAISAVGAQLEPHIANAGALGSGGGVGGGLGGGNGGNGGGNGLHSISARLHEVELALLNERELRKMVEVEVSSLKERREALHAELDLKLGALRAGHAADADGGGGGTHRGGEYRALDDKVKECAKLIVRMGSELMEETRRRQRLEEELGELRIRLTTLESASNSALAASYRLGARSPPSPPLPPGAYAGGGAGSGYRGDVRGGYGGGDVGGGYGGAYGSPTGGGGRGPHSAVHSVAPSPPGGHAAGTFYRQAAVGAQGGPGAGGGDGAPTAAAVAAHVLAAGGNGGEAGGGGGGDGCFSTWDHETGGAIDAQLQRRGIMETPLAGAGGATCGVDSCARPGAVDTPGGGGASGEGGRRSSASALSSAAVDERVRSILSRSNPSLPTLASGGPGGASSGTAAGRSLSKEELDARVQQILGRHSSGGLGGSSGA